MFEPDDLTELAHRIAYTAARTDIECYTQQLTFGIGIRPIFDVSVVEPEDADHVALSVRYLDARGLLLRTPWNPQRVRILDEPPRAREIPEFLRLAPAASAAA